MRKTQIIPEAGGGFWGVGGAETALEPTGRGRVEGLGQFMKRSGLTWCVVEDGASQPS